MHIGNDGPERVVLVESQAALTSVNVGRNTMVDIASAAACRRRPRPEIGENVVRQRALGHHGGAATSSYTRFWEVAIEHVLSVADRRVIAPPRHPSCQKA